MRPLDRKRNDTALIGLGAVNAQPVDPLQPLGRINQQFVFVARHFVGIQRTEVTDRFAEADRTDIVRSPRLELERQFGVCSTRKRTVPTMSPPPMNGGICSSHFSLPYNTPIPVGP